MRPRSGGRPGAPGRRRRRLRRGPRGRRLPPPPPLPLLLGLLLAAAGPGAARAKETAFVEVVLFESSPSGDYTTHTTGLTGRFSRAGAMLSAEGEIVQLAGRSSRSGESPGNYLLNANFARARVEGWSGFLKVAGIAFYLCSLLFFGEARLPGCTSSGWGLIPKRPANRGQGRTLTGPVVWIFGALLLGELEKKRDCGMAALSVDSIFPCLFRVQLQSSELIGHRPVQCGSL
ncbi:Znrf3 [Phodopus roborovskii]|uniref:Znrf3 protein n=1 Tax=Phodopus roborovskii TaxID=109678 RepID=A0AAV0A0D0_PHORO|nr:Znrf3 [Phodopus roborovskii]